jgi:hypothetical protein
MILPEFSSIILSTAIIPFLTKSGEMISQKVGEKMWEIIKKKLNSDSEKEILQNIEEDPKNEDSQFDLENILRKHLNKDPDTYNQLNELLKEIQSNNNQQISGNDNIAIQNTNNGTITITRK